MPAPRSPELSRAQRYLRITHPMPERFRVVAPSAVPPSCGTLSCCDVEPANGSRDNRNILHRQQPAQVKVTSHGIRG